MFIFFNDTATTEIYTLSLHDALPIFSRRRVSHRRLRSRATVRPSRPRRPRRRCPAAPRSEEHTSELQSRQYTGCRLLPEKKNHTSELPTLQYIVVILLVEAQISTSST